MPCTQFRSQIPLTTYRVSKTPWGWTIIRTILLSSYWEMGPQKIEPISRLTIICGTSMRAPLYLEMNSYMLAGRLEVRSMSAKFKLCPMCELGVICTQLYLFSSRDKALICCALWQGLINAACAVRTRLFKPSITKVWCLPSISRNSILGFTRKVSQMETS